MSSCLIGCFSFGLFLLKWNLGLMETRTISFSCKNQKPTDFKTIHEPSSSGLSKPSRSVLKPATQCLWSCFSSHFHSQTPLQLLAPDASTPSPLLVALFVASSSRNCVLLSFWMAGSRVQRRDGASVSCSAALLVALQDFPKRKRANWERS